MQDQRTIKPISEEVHNLAINTLMTERQELLLYRQHTQNIEKALEEGRQLNNSLSVTLKEAQERIVVLEEEAAEALTANTEAVKSQYKSSGAGKWKIENADELGKKFDCIPNIHLPIDNSTNTDDEAIEP